MSKKNWLTFIVSQVPTLTVLGVQTLTRTVVNDAGKEITTVLGELRKMRGKAIPYDAFLIGPDGKFTQVKGDFETKSQAAHAIRLAFYADERAVKVAAREAKAQAVIDRRTARLAAKASGSNVSAPADVIDPKQAARDKKNARRRELRRLAKQAA